MSSVEPEVELNKPDSELDDEETLAYVTPYAFNVNTSILGKALAKPWKRLVAISIDGLLIAILSTLPFILAIGVFIIAFIKRHRHDESASQLLPEKLQGRVKSTFKAIFKLFIVLFLLNMAVGAYFYFSANPESNYWQGRVKVQGYEIAEEKIQGAAWELKLALFAMEKEFSSSSCQSVQCWQKILAKLSPLLKDFVEEETGREVIHAYVEKTNLNEEQKIELETALFESYGEEPQNSNIEIDFPANAEAVNQMEQAAEKREEAEQAQSPHYSLISWFKGILSDLGLGFGWAMIYFTVFTSSFSGATPGKYLMRLRVRKLDNTKITFWDSFGRYGGYAAGITTGLLGFLQIYWDPNRQAIQDKIAATIVLDVSKPDWDKR